ncbi:cation:proton antiporter [Desertivirga xinjiangensis]|uniref:cation:proton antiporter n=1 Tax=Desertivirga xinjiangensis TaxID=539206 RepID=UPI00210E0FFD|nr:cation:proton antiporter [Pedobacter xinjiangensis]
MDEYFLLLALIGFTAFSMAWMPAISKVTGISYSIIYLVAGVLFYKFFPDVLPTPDVHVYPVQSVRIAELIVIISLMGTGIKLNRAFSFRSWQTPLRLISIAMLLSIGLAALFGYTLLGLSLASALLLGAALAPTDPVLASDVQVGPPKERIESETKFSLTSEAGLNDGMAFPFTWLAIIVAQIANGTSSGNPVLSWAGYYFLYKIILGLAIGYAFGRIVGYLVFNLTERYASIKTRDGFLAISLTLIVYGVTELVHGYGFIAVFVSSITLRHFDKQHDYHDNMHSFVDQTERLLVAVVLILFGGALVSGILEPLTWGMAFFAIIFVFIIRPVAAICSLYGTKMHIKERLAISFFGIRGIGSIFYLAFAFGEANFEGKDELWAIVAFTILLSIIIHGLTATPVMKHLENGARE